ncbi:hypothetical protein CEXT_621341 [Caerostris extrusa]|uniref:Uncharacterized protein n=1 Tax=Caerostris extrusa TaxID=172846 RepID=A0AAV4V1C3_CAEEX|nr:hypothetical protein CEXT_621341 [Caerostris extrusa]
MTFSAENAIYFLGCYQTGSAHERFFFFNVLSLGCSSSEDGEMSNPDLASFTLCSPSTSFCKNSKRFERRGPLALNNTLLCHTLINSADKHDSTMGNNQAALEF